MKKVHWLLVPLLMLLGTCASDIKGAKGLSGASLSIRGGGKISWDLTADQVSFTEDIVINDYSEGSTITISPDASPVNLGAADEVAFVPRSGDSGSSTTVTQIDVVSVNSLSGEQGVDGVIALFQRTGDGTLWVPAAQKEISSGDHWQFGAAQTWYERIASHSKPNFKSNASDSSRLLVPASSAAPAAVYIDGKLYANSSDASLNLDTAGRNGRDGGSKVADAIYYLYAIAAVSGRTFELVCSLSEPDTGPTNFSSWSYLGAFRTITGSAIANFSSVNGKFKSMGARIDTVSDNGNTNFNLKTIKAPTFAKVSIGLLGVSGAAAAGDDANIGGNSAQSGSYYTIRGQVDGTGSFGYVEVPLDMGNTVYIQTSNAANSVSYDVLGWIEDPMEYK